MRESVRPNKKFTVTRLNPTLKDISFGDVRYEDFTTHKDNARKAAYLERHISREDWNDPDTPGFWSRWLLWNYPTLREAVADIEQRFGVHMLNAHLFY